MNRSLRLRIGSATLAIAAGFAAMIARAQSPIIALEAVLQGLSSPLYVTHAHDGSNRLFVVEQTGRIKVLAPGASTPAVFLDISSKIVAGGEQGLLGLAFHPQFASNSRLFVDYTRQSDGATVIAEYLATGDPAATAASEKILLTIPQPFANHNGGMVEFGPDGYLYIAMGDGGSGNDPGNRAQNIDELLGKILRIDVDHPANGLPYSSPAGNPFAGLTPGRLTAYVAACLQLVDPAHANETKPGTSLPSFKELEAQGATIGKIRADAQNIFDLDDPREDNFLFRLVNALHIGTRPAVIEQVLLFRPGQRVSVQVIDETERLLHTNRFLYDVVIKPAAYRDGVVDIDVITRDTWTIDIAGKYSRSGGSNTTRFGIKDYNFLGTGVRVGISQTSNADRRGSEFQLSHPRAFDGWTDLEYLQGRYDDGSRKAASVTRPFYALDTRWAAGVTWDRWDRIDSLYNAGDVVGQYRHQSKNAEVFGGWSPGLVDGWTQRYSVGTTMQDDVYAIAPDRAAPATIPSDHAVRALFLRHEVVEDRYVKLRNRDQIARTEFVAMGFSSRLQITRSLEAWGASRSTWLYSASVSKGFTLPWGHDLLATASAERRIAGSGSPLTQVGTSLRYSAPQTTHAAFYGALSGDRIGDAGAPDQLQLGGDNGLRGYPLRYQNGERRALLTLEQRVYTDWYPFRLLRVGGAVFYDRGRAWGGVNQNTVNGGWLSDAGIGLRIALDRAAFANVLHADIAVPINRAPGIKAVQYLVKTELTF